VGWLDVEVPQYALNAKGLDQIHELTGTAHQEMDAKSFEFVRADSGHGSDDASTMKAGYREAPPSDGCRGI